MKATSLPNLNRETTSFPNFFTLYQDVDDDDDMSIDERPNIDHGDNTEASETSPFNDILSLSPLVLSNEVGFLAAPRPSSSVEWGSSVGSNSISGESVARSEGTSASQLWRDLYNHPDFKEHEFGPALNMKIRLVRCPKCQKVLPERNDFSVYKCGGCGTILRAKNEILVADALSQKSDEERVQGGSDKYRENFDISSFPEKGRSLSDELENNVKSNGSYTRRADKRVISGQSFFGGIPTKSFKDSFESNQTIEISSTNVTVNGHPMSDHLLKKAEKLSGPIQPGHYWYDFRAGFWGVMGGPCLGIIPPFIEEFDYPMSKNCAGGNTSVFVNGRELHQKDLSLLFRRGLPTTRYRSYIIEITGRVLDEDSGEELESLGKLAPTVEKVKRGFGMRVPRVAA